LPEDSREGFRSVSRLPPGALSRARASLLELAPDALGIFDTWASLASICDTGWLSALRRPVNPHSPHSATARIARRRLRVLTSLPLSFAAFGAMRSGDGPLHLRGTCAPLPGHDPTVPLWRVELRDDAEPGGVLIEEGHDFLLSVVDGDSATASAVYVAAAGGHLVSSAPLCAGDEVSVFGFADEVPDRTGLAPAPHGRGGLLRAIRSGSELPLLLTHARGEPASSARRVPSREGPGREG
jgi:hypothetical protein